MPCLQRAPPDNSLPMYAAQGGGARRLARWLCALLPAGPEAAHGGGRVRGPDIALPDLPLDLLVHICSFLAVPER